MRTDTIGGGGDFVVRPAPGRAWTRTDTLQFDPQIRRADILFLVDTTGSMGGEIDNLQTELTGLVGRIRTTHPGHRVRRGALRRLPGRRLRQRPVLRR